MEKDLIMAVIMVPMILLLSVTVFTSFFNNTQSNFKGTVIVNESIGLYNPNPNALTTIGNTKYPAVANTIRGNVSHSNGTVWKPDTQANITFANADGTTVVSVSAIALNFENTSSTYVNVTYTPYSVTGYTQFNTVFSQSLAGYSLGALVPFVLIAMVLVGVVIKFLM